MSSKRSLKPILFNVLLIAGLLAGFGLVHVVSSGSSDSSPHQLKTLAEAPAFELPLVTSDLTMQGVRLADFRGQTVLVNFWASWCNVCREEAALLEDLYQKSAGTLKVIAVASYDNPLNVRESERYKMASYLVAMDPDGRLAGDYKVNGLPQTFLIDGEGRIRKHLAGPLTADRISGLLQDVSHLAKASVSQPKI